MRTCLELAEIQDPDPKPVHKTEQHLRYETPSAMWKQELFYLILWLGNASSLLDFGHLNLKRKAYFILDLQISQPQDLL